MLLLSSIDADIPTFSAFKNDPSKLIAESEGATKDPEYFIEKLPEASSRIRILSSIPSVVTGCVGCNMCVTIPSPADIFDPLYAITASAPSVNVYPSSYNKRVTVITFPPFLKYSLTSIGRYESLECGPNIDSYSPNDLICVGINAGPFTVGPTTAARICATPGARND